MMGGLAEIPAGLWGNIAPAVTLVPYANTVSVPHGESLLLTLGRTPRSGYQRRRANCSRRTQSPLTGENACSLSVLLFFTYFFIFVSIGVFFFFPNPPFYFRLLSTSLLCRFLTFFAQLRHFFVFSFCLWAVEVERV